MKDHSVDFDDSPLRVHTNEVASEVPDSFGSDSLEIGLTNERFRVKNPSLRVRGATIPLQDSHGELDLSQGALAVSASASECPIAATIPCDVNQAIDSRAPSNSGAIVTIAMVPCP